MKIILYGRRAPPSLGCSRETCSDVASTLWCHTVSHCVEADATAVKHMGRSRDNKRQAGLRTFNSEGVGQNAEGYEGIVHDWLVKWCYHFLSRKHGKKWIRENQKTQPHLRCTLCENWAKHQGSSKGGNWWSLGLRQQGWKQSYKPHERMWLDEPWAGHRVLISAQPREDR